MQSCSPEWCRPEPLARPFVSQQQKSLMVSQNALVRVSKCSPTRATQNHGKRIVITQRGVISPQLLPSRTRRMLLLIAAVYSGAGASGPRLNLRGRHKSRALKAPSLISVCCWRIQRNTCRYTPRSTGKREGAMENAWHTRDQV